MSFDQGVLENLQTIRTETLNDFMNFMTFFGNWEFLVPLGILISILFLCFHKKKEAVLFFISTLGGEGVVFLLKNIIERPRPPIIYALSLETGYSFPSGHTFLSIAFYGMLTVLLWPIIKKSWKKIILGTLTSLLILLISFSRIYLGVHYVSDVFGSLILSGMWVFLLKNKL